MVPNLRPQTCTNVAWAKPTSPLGESHLSCRPWLPFLSTHAPPPDVQLKALYQNWLAARELASAGFSSRSEWKLQAALASSPTLK